MAAVKLLSVHLQAWLSYLSELLLVTQIHDRAPRLPPRPQVGNAVPPPLARALGREIARTLQARAQPQPDSDGEVGGN